MRNKKTSLFLMELIIAILFFSLASVVCIRLFVFSHDLSRNNVEKNHAIKLCQNTAERFYASENDFEDVILYYDASWNPSEAEENAVYTLICRISEQNGFRNADIHVTKKEEDIFALNCRKYLSERKETGHE